MRTAIMIALVVLAGSTGDLLITKGMRQVGEITTMRLTELAGMLRRIAGSRHFQLGILCMAVSFFAFLAVLSWADLSFVVPATSLSFVITTGGAKLFLKEHVSMLRWTGTLLVCLGVALISLP
ncbi:MAG TPA: EamA family transporter [Blastocatellia bacterium]|jgi:drug/metabolite transporter (DMT)-like permease|nr:EamA family transporter [Blastocatellia bacterium]